MANKAVLERHGNAVVSALDPNIERQIEAALERVERIEDSAPARTKGSAHTGHWRFRMPQAGVRYYTF